MQTVKSNRKPKRTLDDPQGKRLVSRCDYEYHSYSTNHHILHISFSTCTLETRGVTMYYRLTVEGVLVQSMMTSGQSGGTSVIVL